MPIGDDLASEDFCYLTTTGRLTGRPHTVEIWFAADDDRLYVLAGGREKADFIRNARRQPKVTVRIGDRTFAGDARILSPGDEDALARRLLLEKYGPQYHGDLGGWGRDALPLAVDLDA